MRGAEVRHPCPAGSSETCRLSADLWSHLHICMSTALGAIFCSLKYLLLALRFCSDDTHCASYSFRCLTMVKHNVPHAGIEYWQEHLVTAPTHHGDIHELRAHQMVDANMRAARGTSCWCCSPCQSLPLSTQFSFTGCCTLTGPITI